MLFIIIWLLFGLICGIIANSKHRNVAVWVVLGIFGGFISLIILACLPKINPVVEDKKLVA